MNIYYHYYYLTIIIIKIYVIYIKYLRKAKIEKMGETGLGPGYFHRLEAKSDLHGIDVMKVNFINELQTTLKDRLFYAPRYVANNVFSEVIQQATSVEYEKVKTQRDKIKLVNDFMEVADKKYREVQATLDRMNLERQEFMSEREHLLGIHKRNNSPGSPKKSKSSICPASCAMMGGRSYKYRNMRKSSRNMRKSHRKSRK